MCLTDARYHILFNAYIYTGYSDVKTVKDEQNKLIKPTKSILHLPDSIQNSNRNGIADNWFSSLELVK